MREELRFINNLAILYEIGRPLLASLRHLRASCQQEDCLEAYDAMIQAAERGGDFTDPLADYPQLVSRTSLAVFKAGRRSSCLGVLLPKLSRLVRATVEGEWDPRQRFFMSWALMVEGGISIPESLGELAHDFRSGPMKEVAEGLRSNAVAGRALADGARRFPEIFDEVSIDLLRYGEARDLARALRGITRLL